MNDDYISEYLKNSGAIDTTVASSCNDKDKSVYRVNVNKCLDSHCKRTNKSRLENGKCPKGVKKKSNNKSSKKSKNKSRNKSKSSANRKKTKKKSKNQS